MIFAKDGRRYMIRLSIGESILDTLKAFAEKQKIAAGVFNAIGAASEIGIAYYDLPPKKYLETSLDGTWEVVSMTGNIAALENNLFLHAHAVFSNPEMHCKGGHVMRAVAGPTLEVFLTALDTPMKRLPDEAIGLNLLNF